MLQRVQAEETARVYDAKLVDTILPVVPGLIDPVKSFGEISAFAKEAGYPIMIKAVAGGGGRGMRPVHHHEDLEEAYARCRSEAQQGELVP